MFSIPHPSSTCTFPVGATLSDLLKQQRFRLATRSDPQAVLQEGSRGSSFGRGRSRLSGLMVAGEVALSVILLVSGGLMFRTLYKLQHIYLGFEENNITSFIAFPGNAGGFFSFEKKQAVSQDQSIALRVYQPMADKLSQLPGVVNAAYANALPFEGIDMNTSFDIVGQPEPAVRSLLRRTAVRPGDPGLCREPKTCNSAMCKA